MLSDSAFRKTARCNYYESFLNSKKIQKFPIIVVESGKIDESVVMNKAEFSSPFVINGTTSQLGLTLPPSSSTLMQVADVIGHTHPINIIEVGEQNETTGYTLGEYASYLANRTTAHKVINMISLEISLTKYAPRITSPMFVRKIDWIDIIWPDVRTARNDYPRVQKYCLSGMATSYTDFHIDFGGTSVWYSVVSGHKRFYLAAPTINNLKAFQKWSTSTTQSEVFFGDLIPKHELFVFDLLPGQTFMIPSGWIHSVYTPKDSLVFGGNFLHMNAILRQLQVYQIEDHTKIKKQYRFPLFRQINCQVLCTLLPVVTKMYLSESNKNDEDDTLSDALLETLEDEYEPAHIHIAQSLYYTAENYSMFDQIPLLLKVCSEWLSEMTRTDMKELAILNDMAASYAKCASMQQVLSDWWELLHFLAKKIDSRNGKKFDIDSTSRDISQQSAVVNMTACEYITHIQNLASPIDLLDPQVVDRALVPFHNEMNALYASIGVDPAALLAVKEDKKVVDVQDEKKLSLSFKLKRPSKDIAAAAAMSTVDTTDTASHHSLLSESVTLPSQSVDDTAAEDVLSVTAATASSYQPSVRDDSETASVDDSYARETITVTANPVLSLDQLNAMLSSDDEVENELNEKKGDHEDGDRKKDEDGEFEWDDEVEAPGKLSLKFSRGGAMDSVLDVLSAPAPMTLASFTETQSNQQYAKQIVSRMKPDSKTTSQPPSSSANRSIKLTLNETSSSGRKAKTPTPAERKPAPVKQQSYNTVQTAVTEGQRQYGTRGIKLSAKFLQQTMDVDFLGDDNDATSTTTLLAATTVDNNITQQTEDANKQPAADIPVSELDSFLFHDGVSGDEEEYYSDDAERDAAVDRREEQRAFLDTLSDGDDEEDDAYSDYDDEDEDYGRTSKKRNRSTTSTTRRSSNNSSSGGNRNDRAQKAALLDKKRRKLDPYSLDSIAAKTNKTAVAKPKYIVDKVSYNSYMGVDSAKPVIPQSVQAASTAAAKQQNIQKKPVGNRNMILKKLGMK